jgi:acetyl esterase/lipase
MMIFRVSALAAVALLASLAANGHLSSNTNIRLWDEGKVPLATGTGPLDSPFLTVVAPPADKRNGASVIVAPGGANIMLMYGGEGLDIAERYAEWGVTAFILTYRLSPRYNDTARALDGQRAIQIVRANASQWNLDANRIG